MMRKHSRAWVALIIGLGACGGADASVDASDPASDARATSDAPIDATLPPDPCIAAGTCPAGTWINVTPIEMTVPEFGPGPVVADPRHPTDLYTAGGGAGVWRSTDYGNTWTQINQDIGYVPMGMVLAVAGTEPATVLIAGNKVLHRSTDGGQTFTDLPNDLPAELYSLAIDPADDQHLVSGLHEADGVVESTDGGATWTRVDGATFPPGGKSWYPFFLDTGDPATTRTSWFAIAQDGGTPVVTRDGGAHWATPPGLEGLTHAHGNAQIFQRGMRVFVPGVGGPGDGVYRSDDGGATFARVRDGVYSVAWGTATDVYAMWGWACAGCDLGARFATAPLPGDTWTAPATPPALVIGANHVAVTTDGTHDVFVGTMWSTGLWRYVAP
ncbi:MAG: hypothetical protein K8W52_38885 [Deltaproteobacteria bacterium]|nr:hypothetical protein [Deltaproteobacteria bacterium]